MIMHFKPRKRKKETELKRINKKQYTNNKGAKNDLIAIKEINRKIIDPA